MGSSHDIKCNSRGSGYNLTITLLLIHFLILQVFDAPTKLFSTAQVPLITEVLPNLDAIEASMIRVRDEPDAELLDVVRVAAQAALLLIEKYYTLMNECDLYIIAIGTCFVIELFKF